MLPIHVVATVATYRRPAHFERLLGDLVSQARDVDKLSALIWSDGKESARYVLKSFEPYAPPQSTPDLRVLYSRERRGKERYWQTINDLWQWTRQHLYGEDMARCRILQLDDDFRLHPQLLQRAEALLQRGQEKGLSGVRLHRDGRHSCWGLKGAEKFTCGARRINWVDGGWYGSLKLLDALDWQIAEVNSRRWEINPLLGSGVWQQASKHWYKRGIHFIQPEASLVLHDDNRESRMNPDHPRKTNSAHTVGWDPTK